jgi:IclR family transcriptional regulator, acetate operon repressor
LEGGLSDPVAAEEEQKVVGADRVLAVLLELAEHPNGATLEEMSLRLSSSKSTVHRALASLRRARLASQVSRGVYVVGDEFIRLAFQNYSARSDSAQVGPALLALSDPFNETAHYAVL